MHGKHQMLLSKVLATGLATDVGRLGPALAPAATEEFLRQTAIVIISDLGTEARSRLGLSLWQALKMRHRLTLL